MARVLRGEIYWADLNPVRSHEQAGRRPVVVLSHEVFNRRSGTVIAMAIEPGPEGGVSTDIEARGSEAAKAILGKNQSGSNSLHKAPGQETRPSLG